MNDTMSALENSGDDDALYFDYDGHFNPSWPRGIFAGIIDAMVVVGLIRTKITIPRVI